MPTRLLALLTTLALAPACLFDADELRDRNDELANATDDEDGEATEGEDGASDDADANAPNVCLEVEQPCERGLDCCNYDPDFPPGSTQCVQVDEVAACTTICFEPDDCASGCCAALDGIEDYGACVDASVCTGA